MKNPRVRINIQTKRNTSEWIFGRQILCCLCATDASVVPQFIGNVRVNIPFAGIQDCEPIWAPAFQYRVQGTLYDARDVFQWRRARKIQSNGMVRHTLTNYYGEIVPGSIFFEARWSRDVDWVGLFASLVSAWEAQLGMLHLYTEDEEPYIEKLYDFRRSSFGPALNPAIQQFGWAMAMGDEFSEVQDWSRIADAGYRVREYKNGKIFTITESLSDVADDFAGFHKARSMLRAKFPKEFFAPQTDMGPWFA